MKNSCENDKIITTPERKREYIHRWLQEHSDINAQCNTDSNEQTPPGSPKLGEKCVTSFAHLISPVLGRKHSASCTPTTSPILGGKRTASSPIIGGQRRNSKRIKVARKLNVVNTKEVESLNAKLQAVPQSKIHTDSIEYCDEDLIFENNSDVETIEKTKLIDFDMTINSSTTIECNDSINKKVLCQNNKTKNFISVPKILKHAASQFIESISTEDTKSENTEIMNVQEIHSDTDKTASDLIEDISTQLILGTPHKQNQVPLSQNISNPSISDESESLNNAHISEYTVTGTNTNHQTLETYTPTDPIDSISTLESKIDFSKESYILQYSTDKPKKRKNFQKGGLLDTLFITMGKEKSNVNLLRHQLCRKPTNVIEKPFIHLQIIQHLPMINDNQLLKCVLIEDSMGLLSDLLKNKNHRFITVINVPEISCIINANQKPILKVYEPWTIIDPDQLLLHITRFIAIPTGTSNDLDVTCGSIRTRELRTVHEFHCPCIDENGLSNKCDLKFRDCPYNIVKMVFN